MSNYVGSLRRPPRTLTDDEQRTILKVTGESREHFRDHVIISVALGTGLREHEIAALDVGDVFDGDKIRRRVALRVFKARRRPARGKRFAGPGPMQEVFLPDAVLTKLAHYIGWRFGRRPPAARHPLEGEARTPSGVDMKAPLFATEKTGFGSERGSRVSTRTLRRLFRLWQLRAGFNKRSLYPFHCLRHTAITNLYRATRDVRKAQKHARHANLNTTMIYTHVSDEEMLESVRKLRA